MKIGKMQLKFILKTILKANGIVGLKSKTIIRQVLRELKSTQ